MPKMTETLPTLGDWTKDAPWRTRAVAILLIPGDITLGSAPADAAQIAHDLDDKRHLVENHSCNELLALWHGNHYTTARRITEVELREVAKALA